MSTPKKIYFKLHYKYLTTSVSKIHHFKINFLMITIITFQV